MQVQYQDMNVGTFCDHHGGVLGEKDGLNDYKMSLTKKFGKCLNRKSMKTSECNIVLREVEHC